MRNGAQHRVATAPLRNASFVVDRHGVVRFAYGWNSQAREEVYYRADENAPWSLLLSEYDRGVSQTKAFDTDDARDFMTCASPEAVTAICPWDVASQKLLAPVWSSLVVSPDALELSLDGRQVVGVAHMPGMPAITPLVADADTSQVIRAFSQQFPGEFAVVVSSTDDGR